MARYLLVYGKYTILGCMVLFIAVSLLSLTEKDTREQKGLAVMQSVLLFVLQLCAYMTMVLRTHSMQYLLIYLFAQILTLILPLLMKMIYPGINACMQNMMCLLLACGLIILSRLDVKKSLRQLLIASIAFVISLAIPWILLNVRQVRRLGYVYMLLGVSLLGIVAFYGNLTNGSKLSFQILGITFQPSEFVKLTYIFFLAALLEKSTRLWHVIWIGLFAAVHVLILVVSKDLGSALIFFAAYVILITIAAHKLIYLILGSIGAAGAAVGAYMVFSHVRVRFQAWRDPWSTIDAQGYQITQSLFAMSRGGLWGMGIGKGSPSDIPYVETDFVFSAITEELGIFFAVLILLGCLILFYMMLQLGSQCKDGFYRYLCCGFAGMYLFQVFLTVGGGTKLIPLTGVTLPYISYGGSSCLTSIWMIACIQSVYQLRYEQLLRLEEMQRRYEEDEEPEDEGLYEEDSEYDEEDDE